MASTSGRRKSRRAKRIRYTEDDDDDVEFERSTPPRSQPSRQSRLARPDLSYREDSSDSFLEGDSDDGSDEDDGDDGNEEDEFDDNDAQTSRSQESQQRQQMQRPQRQQRRRRLGQQRQQSRQISTKSPGAAQKRRCRSRVTRSSKPKQAFELFKPRKPNISSTQQDKLREVIDTPDCSNFPWHTLPYLVLVDILKYSAYPLYDKNYVSTGSIAWLVEVSRLCKSLREACLCVLLYSPPLYSSDLAHRFIKHFGRGRDGNGRLVRCIDIEAKRLLINRSGINLEDLIACTPQLRTLRLYHYADDMMNEVWAQPNAMNGPKWSYPKDLAAMLGRHSIKLSTFEWNGRFASPLEALVSMKESHSQAAFVDLENLTLLNIMYPERHSKADVQAFTDLSVVGLQSLQSLKSLTFRQCDILDRTVMSNLPSGLRHLEITHCSSLTSEDIESYLSSRGASLLSLRLIGNQAMSLGFIPDLKSSCPQLQDLYIDFTYIDASSYSDRDPLYDELLPNGQATWPATLVNINLEYLRQLSAAEAEGFFTSLVEAAPDLRWLRRLSIKAIVNDVGWRERAQVRLKWMATLTKTFLRQKPADPASSLPLAVRARTPEKQQQQQQHHHHQEQQPGTAEGQTQNLGRRSGRLKQIQDRLDDLDSSDAASPASSLAEPQATNALAGGAGARQGTCDVVELFISDQRPAPEQYNEEHFLDTERSGDEDFEV